MHSFHLMLIYSSAAQPFSCELSPLSSNISVNVAAGCSFNPFIIFIIIQFLCMLNYFYCLTDHTSLFNCHPMSRSLPFSWERLCMEIFLRFTFTLSSSENCLCQKLDLILPLVFNCFKYPPCLTCWYYVYVTHLWLEFSRLMSISTIWKQPHLKIEPSIFVHLRISSAHQHHGVFSAILAGSLSRYCHASGRGRIEIVFARSHFGFTSRMQLIVPL